MSQLQDDQTPQDNIKVTKDHSDIIDSIFNSGMNATATSPLPSPIRIPKVPTTVGQSKDYEKYYVPKVVSIGPYHFWNQNLKAVQNLKPRFTMRLLKDKDTLTSLYNKLCEPQMVQELRNFYEENSTAEFSDMEFAKMMLLDACFVLYYIKYIFGKDCPELNNRQIKFAHLDLLLLENQIPFKALKEVVQLTRLAALLRLLFEYFISESNILTPLWPKMKRFSTNKFNFDACYDHLLQAFHCCLTGVEDSECHFFSFPNHDWCSFRNASELAHIGIHFQPSGRMSLSSVKFSRGWLWFLANIKLPQIKVNGTTKHILLNLIAYESSFRDNKEAWVTSYVCLLDSLIEIPEDVKILRKAWVLETSLGSDEEVAQLFNEIGSEIVPDNLAYVEIKYKIHYHYASKRSTLFYQPIYQLFSQLKNEYFRSPWAVFVLLGALLGLFLSAVQTYLSLTGECDNLCKSLRAENHHL